MVVLNLADQLAIIDVNFDIRDAIGNLRFRMVHQQRFHAVVEIGVEGKLITADLLLLVPFKSQTRVLFTQRGNPGVQF